MALEVARQPANTPEGKRMKKDAQNYVRAFESRFQNEAFVRSGRDPYTAGGKGAAKDETKVDKVGKSKPASKAMLKKQTEKMKQNTRVKITGTASTTPRVSGSMIKSQPKTVAKSKSADGSNTKPYNVKLIKPSEIIKDKPKAKSKTTGIQATKKAVERTVGKAKLAAGMGTTKKKMTQTKPPMKPGTNPKIGAKPAVKKAGKK
jgi:hypothetical protein